MAEICAMRIGTTLIAVFLTISSVSARDVGNNIQDPVVQFWTWFQLNEKRLRGTEGNPYQHFPEIHDRLQKIAPGLAIEANPYNGFVWEITITANGNEDLFPAVEDIVKKAPPLPGWKFVAFRQQLPREQALQLEVKAGDFRLAVKDMKFFPVWEKDTLDLIIYVDGINDENYQTVALHGLILLDFLLGEYNCVKKVRSFDFHPMPKKPEELKDLKELIELPALVK